MPIIDMHVLFLVFMSVLLSVWVVLFLIIVMHFLMPKAVLNNYFKPPYFKSGECALFTGFPYAPMRTIMLMRVLGFPHSGEKRGLTQAYKLVPQWYRISSKLVISSVFIIATLLVILCLIFSADLFLSS
jgi:hypothetical protein